MHPCGETYLSETGKVCRRILARGHGGFVLAPSARHRCRNRPSESSQAPSGAVYSVRRPKDASPDGLSKNFAALCVLRVSAFIPTFPARGARSIFRFVGSSLKIII
jgi:hypothetical protein